MKDFPKKETFEVLFCSFVSSFSSFLLIPTHPKEKQQDF